MSKVEHIDDYLDQASIHERECEYMSANLDEDALKAHIVLPNKDEIEPLKLVALDLDGTTLREDKTFSERLIKVCKQLQEKGIIIVICSGRAPESILPLAKILGIDQYQGYCVCFNGGSIINLQDINKDLYISTINAQDMIDLELIARKCDCAIHAYSTRRVLITESNSKFTEMEIASSMQPFEKLAFPHELKSEEKAYKLIAVGESDKLDLVKASLPQEYYERFNVARTHPNFLEFMHKGCSKGQALVELAKILKISVKNMVAFGDAENDIEMVRDVGVGVAVGNAMPSLKAVSKYTTTHYMADGVAQYLEQLFELEN